MGKYIGHRLVLRSEPGNTFWTDGTVESVSRRLDFLSAKVVLAALPGLLSWGERTQHFLKYVILFDAINSKTKFRYNFLDVFDQVH